MLAFSGYDSAAKFTRERLGVSRLSPAQAQYVRDAVARHNARSFRISPQSSSIVPRLKLRILSQARAVIKPILEGFYRLPSGTWAGGDVELNLIISPQPHAYSRSRKAWSRNGKWSGNNVYFDINIQASWRKYVYAVPGLAIAGGMLTTHARQVEPNLWQASWIRQARGFDLRAESGYIYRVGEQFFHGKSASAAKAVATRRLKAEWLFERSAQTYEKIKLLSFDQMISAYGDVVVERRDSLRAGNCTPGTDNWIERHFPDRSRATVAEILNADRDERVLRAAKIAVARKN